MNEEVDPTSIDADNLVLDYGTVTGASPAGPNIVRYSVDGLVPEGNVTYRLIRGAVTDVYGNPSSAYVGEFHIDDPRIQRYASADVPVAIPDLGTAVSTLTIPSSVLVADLDVELDISHTYDGDLAAVLVSPGGTRVTLFSDVGNGGDDFTDTFLDDEAPTAVSAAYAPFTGRYQPA